MTPHPRRPAEAAPETQDRGVLAPAHAPGRNSEHSDGDDASSEADRRIWDVIRLPSTASGRRLTARQQQRLATSPERWLTRRTRRAAKLLYFGSLRRVAVRVRQLIETGSKPRLTGGPSIEVKLPPCARSLLLTAIRRRLAETIRKRMLIRTPLTEVR